MQRLKISKKIWSWALYDWANSTYSTTIMAGFFPVFFKQYWSQGTDPTLTTARLGSVISVSSLFIAIISPALGAFADQRGTKKLFTFLFMIFGALSCGAMALIPAGGWVTAMWFYGFATLGFNASCIYYDALLPSVAPGSNSNFASSLGYSLGYLGGGILLLINVITLKYPHTFGLDGEVEAVKFSFVTVMVWWILFSIPLFKNVPEPKNNLHLGKISDTVKSSILQLWGTLKDLKREKNTLYFLIAFWLYIDGVYTVMTMAVDYGLSIGLKSDDLIAALLLVQFIGFPFALLFSKMANRWGCRTPILICILIYGVTTVLATHMSSAGEFYLLALVIGMVQGGVQALSRSLYSRMIPPHASGEYFGLFNLVGKFASIFGPMLVGLGAYFTGDPRKGMLGLLVLFVVGGALLWKVNEPELADI